jgi:hypothetical protein
VNQAAEHVDALNGCSGGIGPRVGFRVGRGRSLIKPAMQPVLVVVRRVLGEDRSELPFVEDQRPVQALAANSVDPPLGVGASVMRRSGAAWGPSAASVLPITRP